MSAKHVAELEAAFEKVAFEGAESGNLPITVMAQMSQAISLKRIADIAEAWADEAVYGYRNRRS